MIIDSFRMTRSIYYSFDPCSVRFIHCLWETNNGDVSEAELYFSNSNRVAVIGNKASDFIEFYNTAVSLFPWMKQSDDLNIIENVSIMPFGLDENRTSTVYPYDHSNLIEFLVWAINMKIVVEKIIYVEGTRSVLIIFRPTREDILEYHLWR